MILCDSNEESGLLSEGLRNQWGQVAIALVETPDQLATAVRTGQWDAVYAAWPASDAPLTQLVASNLSHQLNNPLAAVVANLDLALREVETRLSGVDDSELLELLKDARAGASRVHEVVSRLETRASPPRKAPPCLGPPNPTKVRRGRLLIVDDDPIVASAIARTLKSEHEVTVCGSGADALGLVAAGQRFDVILCDVMMPQMTGIDLHAELSKVAPHQAARMIFLTGGTGGLPAEALRAVHANIWLEKPFDTHALKHLIDERVRSLDAP